MLKHEIPYQTDSAKIFARIADRPWAVFLDSGQPDSQFGHYDIMVADPFIRLVTNGEQTEVFDSATFDTVIADVVRTNVNTVTVSFSVAPDAGAYTVVITG